jgi:ABC-type transport system involved in cytochrome c biogenesis permease subunit
LEVNGVRPAALPGLAGFLIPAGVACFCLLYLISHARPPKEKSSYDWRGFAQLPVSYEGRTQPVDSLARNALKILSGKETLKLGDGTKVPPIQWLADTIARSDKSADYPVFRIDSPDIKSLLGFDVKDKHFSLNQILKNGDKLDEQFARANQARQADPRNLTDYQRKVLQLGQQLNLYSQFARDVGNVYFLPPLNSGDEWKPLAAGIAAHEGAVTSPAADHLIAAITGYHEDSPEQFNGHVRAYQTLLHEKLPATMDKVSFETFYNYYDPFMQCMVLYVGVFVLACISWLGFTGVFSRTALWVLAIALLLHTLGLIGRVYISGRPPVTNLASSAIFIAWGIVVFGYALELIFRNGIGSAAAAAAGFCSLLIADKLALQGDTMKVLQAVLDTNFWLATHVVVITLGYSATFFAGVIAIVYILVGIFTRASSARLKILTRMIYGVTCFAILFSFVGTILGGIWADQSWGRFWGWDPKENGAILIVLANALLLHARWGGLAGPRGIAMLAVFGNIVTSWSWFGTNMLGVGLHSYGFMDAAFQWLMLFILSQLFLIGISCIPQRLWRSSRTTQSISQKELAENNPSPIPSAVQ